MHTQLVSLLNDLPTLAQDDRGANVAIIQGLLAFYRYLPNHNINGLFDWATDDAVRQFQHDHALYTDGIVGMHTWQVLLAISPEQSS